LDDWGLFVDLKAHNVQKQGNFVSEKKLIPINDIIRAQIVQKTGLANKFKLIFSFLANFQ
jgi:hypothetical protein